MEESHSPNLTLDLALPCPAGEFRATNSDDPMEPRDYISRLEDELRKIESFKRELPLSLMLLNDAIGRLKKEAGSENNRDSDGDKRTWMSSAQLWSSDQTSALQINKSRDEAEEERKGDYTEGGGALSSFHTGSVISPAKEDDDDAKKLRMVPEPAARAFGGGLNHSVRVSNEKMGCRPSPVSASAMQGSKKHRRCWSPELHRRFVDALERLGGPQVATPKQIRDLMQVDGLTNDEVKSHLQKYRLHIRKLPNSTTATSISTNNYDSRLEGGGGSSKAEVSQSGSPQGPLHMATRSANCISSASRSRCNSTEDDDEERSDSHSWKGNHETRNGS